MGRCGAGEALYRRRRTGRMLSTTETSAAAAAAAASCDCAWAQPAAACDGGDDGTPCWRGCCGVLARFHGAVERLVPSYSFGVRQQLWSHFKVCIGTHDAHVHVHMHVLVHWCMHIADAQ